MNLCASCGWPTRRMALSTLRCRCSSASDLRTPAHKACGCLLPNWPTPCSCRSKAGRSNARQRIVQHGGVAAIHFADEAQGQMQLLARLPARAGHAALNQHDALRHDSRDRQRHEQPHRASRPSGRRRGTEAPRRHSRGWRRSCAPPAPRHRYNGPAWHAAPSRAPSQAPLPVASAASRAGGKARTKIVSIASKARLLPNQVSIADIDPGAQRRAQRHARHAQMQAPDEQRS